MSGRPPVFGFGFGRDGSGSGGGGGPLSACLPLAEGILHTQDAITHLRAQLLAQQPSLSSLPTAAPPASHHPEEEEEPEEQKGGDEGMDDGSPSTSATSAAAPAVPFSALPLPAALPPQLPALLRSLHDSLLQLHDLLSTASSHTLSLYFDLLYLPLFTVLVTHPKAQEQQAAGPTKSSAGEGRLQRQTFPMLPHQDRVWEQALKCLHLLLLAGRQEPLQVRAALNKRFFGMFQLLLNFLPSDFRTVVNATPGEDKRNVFPSSVSNTANGSASSSPASEGRIAVWHSEETRMAALTCTRHLFECVHHQFELIPSTTTSVGVPSDLQHLLTTFQLNPSFCISLGYYIHLMLRFASQERSRLIRMEGVKAVQGVMGVLQLEVLNHPTSSASSSYPSPSGAATPFSPLPGRSLLLSYLPGIMSTLFNLLLFDSAKARGSGGWRFQLESFRLFVEATKMAVRHVAGVKEIVDEVKGMKSKKEWMEDADEEDAAAESDPTADRALAQLSALLPKPSPPPSSSPSSASSSPSFRLSGLHPVLQSVLKPVDAAWWEETRKNIDNIMSRVFTATQLQAHVLIAGEMLEAAKGFLVGSAEEERGVDSALLAQGNTIYTSLLPSSCTITWVEYIILCNEHEDAELRRKAAEVIEQLGAKNGAWASQHARPMLLLPGSSPSASPPSSLLPLLTSSLSSHLLRLPRQLPTSSESSQLSLLKTIKGYIDVLGRSSLSSSSSGVVVGSNNNPLWDFVQGNMERIIKIFERIWEVDSKESKVLEREKEGDKDKQMQPQITQNETSTALSASSPSTTSSSSTSTSLSLPTYYSFSFLHLHTPAAHSLSLSILHSLGYYLSSHFGLWLAHLHERLVEGVHEVSERGNYSSTNKLKETLLFINMSMLGLGEAIKQGKVQAYEVMPHLELLLFDYLQPTLWHLPLDNVLRGSLGLPLLSQSDLSNNLVVVSFLVRGVGDMAVALGEEFRPFLMHLLYPLFEKLGSAHATIHQAALVTLHRVAVACGYEEVARTQTATSPPTADDVLQAMLVENMDYLVEQMAVELRNLNFHHSYSTPYDLDPSSASSTAHPLTLPLVLTSLLTRVSLRCTQALIPLLDDILKVILDKLGELSLQEEWGEHASSSSLPPGLVSSSLSRLAYLEILRSVSRAIRLIQEENDLKHPDQVPTKVPEIYASAAPVPLIEETKEQAQLDFVDSMLNLEETEEKEEEKESQPSIAAFSTSASSHPHKGEVADEKQPSDSLPYFAPLSIRRRLEASIRSKHQQARSRRKEEAWLSRTRSTGAHVEEEKDGMDVEDEDDEEDEGEFHPSLDGDVPRDSEGKTRAERWFERNEQKRAKAEARKLNGLAGMGDEEMDAEMEREEKAYKDEPEVPLTPDQQTVLSIFTQCRNYLSTASGPTSSSQRYTVLCTLSECIPVLQRVPKEFFPEIAKLWPVLQQSLRLFDNAKAHQTEVFSLKGEAATGGAGGVGGGFQNSMVAQAGASPMESLTSVRVEEGQDGGDQQLVQLIHSLSTSTSSPASADPSSSSSSSSFTHSTASPLFIQSLSLLSQLSGCAAKFLAGRFSKEVWPLLQHIMQFEARWMGETSRQKKGLNQQQQQLYEKQLKLLPSYKIQQAVLTTLSNLVRYPDISTQHLPSLCMQLRPYLSSEQPLEFQQLAVRCFETLLQLEADVVWHTLWTLCPSLAMEAYEREQKQATPPPAAALPPSPAHFLSHPCFQQVYPNFDARFLLHQRMQASPPSPTPVEYEQNVRRLLQTMQRPDWPEPKLTLF